MTWQMDLNIKGTEVHCLKIINVTEKAKIAIKVLGNCDFQKLLNFSKIFQANLKINFNSQSNVILTFIWSMDQTSKTSISSNKTFPKINIQHDLTKISEILFSGK